jgi:hypothetical protein
MKFCKQTILIALLAYITAQGQIIRPIDSNTVAVPQKEFKSIIQTIIELDAARKINKSILSQNAMLERVINDKDKIIQLRENDVNVLKSKIDIIAPAWYDNFLYGFCAAIIIFTSIILLKNN